MNKVKYISHRFSDNVDDIKALALFFDQIDIVEQTYGHMFLKPGSKPKKVLNEKGKETYSQSAQIIQSQEFTEKEFILHIAPLIIEGLVSLSQDLGETVATPSKNRIEKSLPNIPLKNSLPYVSTNDSEIDLKTDDIIYSNDDNINKLLLDNPSLIGVPSLNPESIYVNSNISFSDPYSMKDVIATSNSLISIEPLKRPHNFELYIYYAKIFKSFIDNIQIGENVITTSKFINDSFHLTNSKENYKSIQSIFEKEFNISPYIVFEAIKLSVPNLGKFPTEEILEFRYKSKDELTAFKAKIEEITFDLQENYDRSYISKNAQRIVNIKVKPLLEGIESNLKKNKFQAMQELLKEAKDPKSYSPLLLTLTNNISNTLAILISLGFITLNAGLEYYSKHKELKKDGIYYLMKMKKYFA